MKKLTVKDIAKRAGVSVTAVSFVLNNRPGVSEKTREKIQKIIKETDFKPNLSSKKLVLNQSFNICLMMNMHSSPFVDLFYLDITRGIIERGMKLNYNVTISRPIAGGTELPNLIYSGDADGIIFLQDISPALIEKAKASGVPFIIADSHSTSDDVTSINPDYRNAAYNATRYLIDRGHRDIAFIGYTVVPEFFEQTRSGFNDAMREQGIAPNEKLTAFTAEDEESAYQIARKLFSLSERPSAILCTADIFAVGVARCAKDMGVSIPNDISLIGIDDIILSRYIEPALTTVGIDKVAMGELAMDMIVNKIRGEESKSTLLPMQLIIRNSVKKI